MKRYYQVNKNVYKNGEWKTEPYRKFDTLKELFGFHILLDGEQLEFFHYEEWGWSLRGGWQILSSCQAETFGAEGLTF